MNQNKSPFPQELFLEVDGSLKKGAVVGIPRTFTDADKQFKVSIFSVTAKILGDTSREKERPIKSDGYYYLTSNLKLQERVFLSDTYEEVKANLAIFRLYGQKNYVCHHFFQPPVEFYRRGMVDNIEINFIPVFPNFFTNNKSSEIKVHLLLSRYD